VIDLLGSNICFGGYCLARPSYIYLMIPLVFILAIFTWITFVKF